VLVCHSLGGLIARLYLINEVKHQRPVKVGKLILYAVPNNGAGLASAAKYVAWRHHQLAQLCRNSDLIEFLNEDWFRLKISRLVSVTYVVAGLDAAVSVESAKGFWDNPNVETVIDRGHIDVVKPVSSDDLPYIILRNTIDERRTNDVMVDLSHQQGEWRGLREFVGDWAGGAVRLTDTGLLRAQRDVERAAAVILAPPFRCQFQADEAEFIRKWVNNGGGLLLMGYHAADTHHGGNPSRIAREFGYEFGDDLVMPFGASEVDCRRQVFANDDRLAVTMTPAGDHPIVAGVQNLALLSCCSIKTDWGPQPDYILKSPDTCGVWHPEGPKGPEGWSRQVIEQWILDRGEAVPLLVASRYGKGRVVLIGTWKLGSFPREGDSKLFAQAVRWLVQA
jgi:hypothetical protein